VFVGGGHEPEQHLDAGVVSGAKRPRRAMRRSLLPRLRDLFEMPMWAGSASRPCTLQ
jgi:hypothetical protein